MDWKTIGPVIARFRALIDSEVKLDTRKLESYDAFVRATSAEPPVEAPRGREIPLRSFFEGRRRYLLDYKEPARQGGE